MCQGGQGNFMQEGQTGPMTNVRPGFTPGGPDDPAQGGTGYYGGGSATWGGDYGRGWGNPWGKWSPHVQNPGMPSEWSPHVQNPGMPSGGDAIGGTAGWTDESTIGGGPRPYPMPGFRPAPGIGVGEGVSHPGGYVQNPGMPRPINGPGNRIGGPAGGYVQNPGMPIPPNGPGNMIGGPEGLLGDPFSGIKGGRLAEAQRLAGLGKMGRAKQQIELGGGTWNKNIHRALRGGPIRSRSMS